MKWIVGLITLFVSQQLLAAACEPGSSELEQATSLIKQARQTKNAADKVASLQKSLGLCRSSRAYYELGKAYMRLGDLDNALSALDSGLELADGKDMRGNLYGRRAHVYLAMDNIGRALSDKDAAMEQFGSHQPRWFAKLRKKIDLHPARQQMSADAIIASLVAKRGFSATPSIDIFVTFKYDSAEPDESGIIQMQSLGEGLDAIVDDSVEKIIVTGHTDVRGDAGYNLRLSKRRADSIVAYLSRTYPALASRLQAVGKGEEEPLHLGNTEEDHRLNRRVEIKMITK